jgi:hypothetical protein
MYSDLRFVSSSFYYKKQEENISDLPQRTGTFTQQETGKRLQGLPKRIIVKRVPFEGSMP